MTPLSSHISGNTRAVVEQALLETLAQGLAKGLPGISIALATQHGGVWTRALGYANLEHRYPSYTGHLYGIGSITKTFVAVVVHQLADEGVLSLDVTPVEILGPSTIGSIPNADSATIAQLLSHTSGIPSWEFVPAWIRRGRGAEMEPARIWGKSETLSYVDKSKSAATSAAGAAYHYSNSNHTILGLVIEKLTGKDVVTVFHERILDRLGLTDIRLEGFETIDSDDIPARYHFATADFRRDAGLHASFRHVTGQLVDVSASNLSVEWTAGGIVATAKALARYGQALRDGILLSSDAQRRLLTFSDPGDYERQVSQGLFREVIDGTAVIRHGGNTLGFGAELAWPENGEPVIVMLTNVGAMHSGDGGYSPSRLLQESDLIDRARDLAAVMRPGDRPRPRT